MAPKRVRIPQDSLNPAWIKETAAMAAKRGTAVIVAADRSVYGLIPDGGGSIAIRYPGNDRWIDEILRQFPTGAIFPDGAMYGGASTAKTLRPYAAIELSDDGTSWGRIDEVTKILHVKGNGTTIHSAAFGSNECAAPKEPDDLDPVDFGSQVQTHVAKLLCDTVSSDQTRPPLGRIWAMDISGTRHLVATDGRSMVTHRCEECPDNFSVNPKLCPLFDIVAFQRTVIKETGSIVNCFRMKDGSVVVEGMVNMSPPPVPSLLDNWRGVARAPFINVPALATLVDKISSLGLGSADALGGVVRFSARRAEMLMSQEPVAEFDVETNLGQCRPMVALPKLAQLVRVGADEIQIIGDNEKCPLVTNTEATTMVCMPVANSAAAQA